MEITYKGDYALKAILDLASHYEQGVVTIHEMAKRIDTPVKFFESVLLELKQGGFVDSKRGINGGYFLLKHPKDIRLGDVVRFIDGPIEPIACASTKNNYKGCKEIHRCVFRDIWIDVNKATSGIIDNITFQDLVEKNRIAASAVDSYNI